MLPKVVWFMCDISKTHFLTSRYELSEFSFGIRQDGSLGKGNWHASLTTWIQFPHKGGKRVTTVKSCPVTSIMHTTFFLSQLFLNASLNATKACGCLPFKQLTAALCFNCTRLDSLFLHFPCLQCVVFFLKENVM